MSTTTIEEAVIHDTTLLSLLGECAEARKALDVASGRVLRNGPEYYVTGRYTYNTYTSGGSTLRRDIPRDDMPVGSTYWQTKTWVRGEEGAYIVTEDGHRKATVADVIDTALEFMQDAYRDALRDLSAARDRVDEHERAYTGWQRYVLVTSSAGHVHRSMHCSTCTPTTTYAPVVALSGRTDSEAVAMLGEHLCSVCFPDAPVKAKALTKAAAAKILKAS